MVFSELEAWMTRRRRGVRAVQVSGGEPPMGEQGKRRQCRRCDEPRLREDTEPLVGDGHNADVRLREGGELDSARGARKNLGVGAVAEKTGARLQRRAARRTSIVQKGKFAACALPFSTRALNRVDCERGGVTRRWHVETAAK